MARVSLARVTKNRGPLQRIHDLRTRTLPDILTNDPGFEPWVEATEVKLDKVEYDIKKTGQAEKFSALQSSEPHHITNHPQSPLLTYPTYLTFLHSLLLAY